MLWKTKTINKLFSDHNSSPRARIWTKLGGEFFLQASRSFQYSSETSETTRNHRTPTFRNYRNCKQIPDIPLHSLYAQTLILVNLILVNCLGFFNFTRNGFSVFDHLLTQDSPIFYLTVCGETGPYIDQGESTLRVWKFQMLSGF